MLWLRGWRKLWQLSWGDRWLLAQALLLLPLAAVAVRTVGFERLRATLVRFTPAGHEVSSQRVEFDVSVARHYAGIVGIAARRGLIHGNCLQRSLTSWWLLTRRSIPAEVQVGVRAASGQLQAHAWLEVQGQVIADRADVRQQFAAFDRAILSPRSIAAAEE